jgi:DNA-directed RNA polymerase subunit RPC12/RpoP
MQQKAVRFFTNSAGTLLMAVALALFVANWASTGLTQSHDPVLMISMRNLFWVVGVVALVVAMVCLFGEKIWLKTILILWLMMNLLAYQIGFLSKGIHVSFGVYLSSLAEAFGITAHTAYLILGIVFLYLLAGSLASLLWLWRNNTGGYLENACAHCGVYIEFPAQGIGQEIACPHCGAMVTLQRPDGAPKEEKV